MLRYYLLWCIALLVLGIVFSPFIRGAIRRMMGSKRRRELK
jgi:hypothetical protein